MGVVADSVTIELRSSGGLGVVASIQSLIANIGDCSNVLPAAVALFGAGDDPTAESNFDLADLLSVEPVHLPAFGAGEIVISPSERYLALVSAVACEANARVVRFLHGWPILSIGGRKPIVADGRDVTSVPAGGLSA
jgi:hypothetical protein